jgi:hypothetical protein
MWPPPPAGRAAYIYLRSWSAGGRSLRLQADNDGNKHQLRTMHFGGKEFSVLGVARPMLFMPFAPGTQARRLARATNFPFQFDTPAKVGGGTPYILSGLPVCKKNTSAGADGGDTGLRVLRERIGRLNHWGVTAICII